MGYLQAPAFGCSRAFLRFCLHLIYYKCSIPIMTDEFEGEIFDREHPGYEEARRSTVWNALTPERYPELILVAEGERDCVRAVKMARDLGRGMGVRSGGHSWAGNHVRDEGVLLDLSKLDRIEVDAENMTAAVEPGVTGDCLDAVLEQYGLFFPVGHCAGVALGGYLLQGGFGWNGRVHGPACMSVEAIDVVTADGRYLRADAHENADLFWAARGAGPGFFGVVTRFHVRLYRRPAVIANGLSLYRLDALDEIIGWAEEIGPSVPRYMELMVLIHRDEAGEPEIAVTGPVLADSEDEAPEALALLSTCPAVDRAKLHLPYVPATLSDLFSAVGQSYPDHHRYAVDNMWTGANGAALAPGIRRIAETLPEAPSHMLWMNWGESPERPDMAYGLEDRTYIALYSVWSDPARDPANVDWVTGNMREMEPLATGIQLADENLGRRPAPFTAGAKLERLDKLRIRRDPERVFHSWMGRP